MRRGDLVTVATSGDYGKPRPALVIQADAFEMLPSVTVLQLTSDIHDDHLIRVTIQPTVGNGLHKPSQIMIDRVVTLPRAKVGRVFGRIDPETVTIINGALTRFFDLETREK